MIKSVVLNPFQWPTKGKSNYQLFIIFLSNQGRLKWNLSDNRILWLKLTKKRGLYHVVLTTPKVYKQKFTLTAIEMQQLYDIENIDFQKEIFCIKCTKNNGRWKVCVNFKTDTDKHFFVVYRYRNNFYHKDNEVDRNLTNTSHSWETSLSIELHWNIFQVVPCTGRNICSYVPSGLEIPFLTRIFRFSKELKLSFEHRSARENPFLRACFFWDSKLSLRKKDRTF